MSNERPTKNPHLIAWVEEMAKLCKPDNVVWCDGSEAERKALTERAVAEKVAGLLLPPLEQERRRPRRAPHLHLHADEG
jgi:phosphoenolpyruvate carboxykinase (GTP)